MNNCLFIIIFFKIFCISNILSQDIPFVFENKRISIGALYVYEVSVNSEDFIPKRRAYYYQKTINEIENFFVNIKTDKVWSILKYSINWKYMMLENSEAKILADDKDIKIGAQKKSIQYFDFLNQKATSIQIQKTETGFEEITTISKLSIIPTYYYQLDDLMSLWFTLRFYPFNNESIDLNHYFNGYNTEFEVSYNGKEEVKIPLGNKLCHKFTLTPKLNFFLKFFFTAKNVHIWLSAEDETRYMVKYKNGNNRDSFTHSIEYRLVEVNKITNEDWANLKRKLGININ